MNAPSPILKLLRVAAVALSLGMLVWFVSRSAGGRSATSATTSLGSVTNSTDSSLEVVAAPLAPSSKSINQPIFSVRQNSGDQPMAPSSKSGVIFREKKIEMSLGGATPVPAPSGTPSLSNPAP